MESLINAASVPPSSAMALTDDVRSNLESTAHPIDETGHYQQWESEEKGEEEWDDKKTNIMTNIE